MPQVKNDSGPISRQKIGFHQRTEKHISYKCDNFVHLWKRVEREAEKCTKWYQEAGNSTSNS